MIDQTPSIMLLNSFRQYSIDIKIVVVAIIYFFTAQLGYFFAFPFQEALPIWPPSGIAFALIILLGRRTWPGIAIGTLLANLVAFWNTPDMPIQAIMSISAVVALGNVLEVLFGYFLINNWTKHNFPFHQTSQTFRFLFISIIISAIGSAISAAVLFAYGVVDYYAFLMTWLSMGVSRVVGILLFTPFVLAIFKRLPIKVTKEKVLETIAAIIAVVGFVFLLQVQDVNQSVTNALPFIIIPFLLWMSFRFPLVISITAIVIVSSLAIYFTSLGVGSFVLTDVYSSMLLVQIYIGVISITNIILASTVKERNETQLKLQQFNETLEEMVKKRTKALKDQIETRRKTEENLQQTNHELSKRNVELDNFVYSVSHDLRAPIASMLGIINLAKMENDLAMKDLYFDMINGSAVQLDNFIREILDQSRNTRVEIKREKIFLKELVDETFNQLKYTSQDAKPVEKLIDISQEKPFHTDSWRVKVILNNLISNAIRYKNGTNPIVKITATTLDQKLILKVEDNGRGISDEHLDKVYEMFYRATDDGAGSGLGLYIVKETIDKLNGTILIESELGKGTTVLVEIPEMAVTKEIVEVIDASLVN